MIVFQILSRTYYAYITVLFCIQIIILLVNFVSVFIFISLIFPEISNRDVFNKNSNNANWIKNETVELVDSNMDLTLGLGELAQLTVNNESESNADVSSIISHFKSNF